MNFLAAAVTYDPEHPRQLVPDVVNIIPVRNCQRSALDVEAISCKVFLGHSSSF